MADPDLDLDLAAALLLLPVDPEAAVGQAEPVDQAPEPAVLLAEPEVSEEPEVLPVPEDLVAVGP